MSVLFVLLHLHHYMLYHHLHYPVSSRPPGLSVAQFAPGCSLSESLKPAERTVSLFESNAALLSTFTIKPVSAGAVIAKLPSVTVHATSYTLRSLAKPSSITDMHHGEKEGGLHATLLRRAGFRHPGRGPCLNVLCACQVVKGLVAGKLSSTHPSLHSLSSSTVPARSKAGMPN